MPVCPKVIVVSKPSKYAWMLEEVNDIIALLDVNARISDTSFPGVAMIYLESGSDAMKLISGIASRARFAFVKRVVSGNYCFEFDKTKLIQLINEFVDKLKSMGHDNVRLAMSLRGSPKKLVSAQEISSIILGSGLKLRKDSAYSISIESVGNLVLTGLCITRSCGFDCELLAPLEVSLN